ncbi:MAG TPA: septum formation initiator family protein [Ilumatobacteraceae bacterium]|nr:septum formation initiator family protein [Ilumatobacteraceae bacterium]
MSSGSHKTSAIPRPKDATQAATRATDRPDSTNHHGTLSDFTRPIAREKQLVKGRAKRSVIALGAMVITAALVAALFVLPVKAWLRQRDDIAVKEKELSALDQANAELSDEVGRLQTPEGIEEAAREEIGYVQRGEIRLTMLPAPPAPITMPSGWPYDTIARIVAVRTADATTPVAP